MPLHPSMNYCGDHEALVDEKGRVVFPRVFRNFWPTNELWARLQETAEGKYLACFPQETPASTRVKIQHQHRLQLGEQLRQASLENPLVWVGNMDHVELWQKKTLDTHLAQIRERNQPLLQRALWPYEQKSF